MCVKRVCRRCSSESFRRVSPPSICSRDKWPSRQDKCSKRCLSPCLVRWGQRSIYEQAAERLNDCRVTMLLLPKQTGHYLITLVYLHWLETIIPIRYHLTRKELQRNKVQQSFPPQKSTTASSCRACSPYALSPWLHRQPARYESKHKEMSISRERARVHVDLHP